MSAEGTDTGEAQAPVSVPCGHTIQRGWMFGYKDIEWYDPECRKAYVKVSSGTWQGVQLDEE